MKIFKGSCLYAAAVLLLYGAAFAQPAETRNTLKLTTVFDGAAGRHTLADDAYGPDLRFERCRSDRHGQP